MQNLDQLRAAHAIRSAATTNKGSVSKLPAMILTNGLLGALAFATEEEKKTREEMKAAADSLAPHLVRLMPEIGLATNGQILAAKLAAGDALTLQRATTEALAYFSYLKRYAPKKDSAETE